jgi:hypothetical protein
MNCNLCNALVKEWYAVSPCHHIFCKEHKEQLKVGEPCPGQHGAPFFITHIISETVAVDNPITTRLNKIRELRNCCENDLKYISKIKDGIVSFSKSSVSASSVLIEKSLKQITAQQDSYLFNLNKQKKELEEGLKMITGFLGQVGTISDQQIVTVLRQLEPVYFFFEVCVIYYLVLWSWG